MTPQASDGAAAVDIAAWFAAHGRELTLFATGVLRDTHLAEDVVQLTFAKAMEGHAEIRPEAIRGWLFTVAFREALVLKRKQASWEKVARRLPGWWLSQSGPTTDPLLDEERQRQLEDGIAGLPNEQIQVLRLRMESDKSFAEIASELGVPLGTVLTRMRLALKKLKSHLKPNE